MKKKITSILLMVCLLMQVMSLGITAFASEAPTVVSVTPSGDNVVKAIAGKVLFSTDMDRTTLTSENIVITDKEGNTITQKSWTAWDKYYTFTADFEPNMEYKLTVSTAVKSAADVGLAEKYEHTFSTGDVVLAASNVMPDESDKYTTNLNSTTKQWLNGSITNWHDKNNVNACYFKLWAGTGAAWVKVDLGSERDIAYISYFPIYKDISNSYINNQKIQVSKNGTDWIDYAIAPSDNTIYAKGSEPEFIVVPTDSEAYRYVRVCSDDEILSCSELTVYAYEFPEVVSITPGTLGSVATDVRETAVGKISFDTDMDRGTLNDTNIVVTDENGNVMKQTGGAWNPSAKQAPAAYDRSYVFACNFEPDTTYTVTVSTKVKSAAGNPLSKEVVHKFTTGHVIYPARDVTPRYASAYTASVGENSSASAEATLKYIYNYGIGTASNMSNTWYNYKSGTDLYVDVNLGEPRRLAYVSVMADYYNETSDRSSGVKIYASKSSDFNADDTVTLGIVPTFTSTEHPQVFWTVISDNPTAEYQYIRISKKGLLYIDELEIFSYDTIDSIDSATSGSYTVEDFALHGTFVNGFDVTLSADVTSETAEVAPKLFLALYRQSGGIDTLVDWAVSDETELGNINASLTLPKDISGCYLKGFIWDGLTDLVPLTRALTTVK